MKKNGFLAIIAMAALSFAACNKEGLPQNDATDLPSDEPVVETPVVLEPGVYPATVVAEPIMPDLAGTKAVFDDGAFAWEAGDAIACFQRFDGEFVEAETNVITTMSAVDADGNFSGNLPYTDLTDKTTAYAMNFIYPAHLVTGLSASTYTESVKINLPEIQDGRLENIGDYFITGAYNVGCKVTESDQEVSITAENVELKKHAVVGIKVNVPEALNVSQIIVKAFTGTNTLGVAGTGNLKLRNLQLKGSQLSSKTLTLKRSDNTLISGDTYACIIPFAKDSGTSKADKYEFILTSASGRLMTFSKAITPPVQGTIYDLGTFPTSCVTPKFSFDENGAVVMTSSPAEAKIYYTTDGSDPSAAEEFLYEGPVEITADTRFKAVAICEGLGNSAVAEYTAAFGVTAAVLKINESGFLTVQAADGHSYKYSISTTGDPGEPGTAFPAEGIDLKSTGSHYIRVEADFFGKTATTNALYRVYYISSELPTDAKVELNASNKVDAETLAPFTATRFASSKYEENTCTLTRGTKGLYWKTNVGGPSNYTIFIGLETRYASDLSLHAFCSATTPVYPRYCGIRGKTAEDGVEVPAKIDDGITTLADWSAWWSIKASAGKMIEFAVPNERYLRGWGVLEQGFEAFNPTAASLSSEAPAAGQNVAY